MELPVPLPPPAAGPAPNEPGVSVDGSGAGPVQFPAAKPGKGTAPVTVLLGEQPDGAATPMMDDMLCICAREPCQPCSCGGKAGFHTDPPHFLCRYTHMPLCRQLCWQREGRRAMHGRAGAKQVTTQPHP